MFSRKQNKWIVIALSIASSIGLGLGHCAAWLDNNIYHPNKDIMYPRTSIDYFLSLDSFCDKSECENGCYFINKTSEGKTLFSQNVDKIIDYMACTPFKKENHPKTYRDSNFKSCGYTLSFSAKWFAGNLLYAIFSNDYSRIQMAYFRDGCPDFYLRYYKVPKENGESIRSLIDDIDGWVLINDHASVRE